MELVGIAIGLAWLVGVLLPARGRSARALELCVLLLTVALVEVAAVRIGGLWEYSRDGVAAPFGVSLGVIALRLVLFTEAIGKAAGKRSAWRVALIAFLDVVVLEAFGTGFGWWRWAEPGPFGFALVGPFAWTLCVLALLVVRSRTRAAAPLVVLVATAVLVAAVWWGVLRWLPGSSSVSLRIATYAPWITTVAALALAGRLVWIGRRLIRTAPRPARAAADSVEDVGRIGNVERVETGQEITQADSADDAIARRPIELVGIALPVAALAALLFIPAPHAADVEIDAPLAADERSVVLVGDVMLGRGVARLVKKGETFDRFFDATRPLLSSADITFGNLESVIAQSGVQKERGIAFRAPPHAADALARAGFDAVSVANNHGADFGPEAMTESRALLGAAGVQPVGVGPADQPQTPVIIERDGHRFGFLAYCDPHAPNGCTHWDKKLPARAYRARDAALSRDIPALRAQVDTVIVSVHWGVEDEPEPDAWQAALGRRMIDLGADIVAGHHSHVHQRAERYRGGVILYSMGNFVFDQRGEARHMESGLYRVVVAKSGVRRAAVLPVRYQPMQYVPAPDAPGMIEISSRSRLR